MRKYVFTMSVGVASILWVSGCTVHPTGERRERALALHEGAPFRAPATQRVQPPLPEQPTPDDLVRHALLTNPELEKRYWEWRAAIEQIPQDGTQAGNFAISGNTSISSGKMSLDRTTVTLGNDPMADLVWPSKLSAAARRALDVARAAGMRFQEAKLELRQNVLDACDDYALLAEQIRLETASAELLEAARAAVEARSATGGTTQQEVLKARNEVDLARNDIANMRSQQVSQRAALHALLSLPANAKLNLPEHLTHARRLEMTDEQIIARAAQQNPELRALAMELRGQREGVRLARLQYFPDFSLAVGSDLAGMMQSLAGMVTIPILRHEAIEASIAQANARLKAADAMVRQSRNDLAARLLLDLAIVRDADRQLALFDKSIVPRFRQIVTLTRTGYETGQSSLMDLLESQRSLLSLEKLVASLKIAREKRVTDIETAEHRMSPPR
jgi:outer membrane protein TolC